MSKINFLLKYLFHSTGNKGNLEKLSSNLTAALCREERRGEKREREGREGEERNQCL